MTKNQLIAKVARNTDVAQSVVEIILNDILNTIIDEMRSGNKVTITGFGRFETRVHKGRKFVNPNTKAQSNLTPNSVPVFKASNILKRKIHK